MLKNILLVLLYSFSAYAGNNQIFQSLMPADNQHEIQVAIIYGQSKVDYTIAGQSAEQKTSVLSLDYRYGLGRNNALGISLGFGDTTSSFSMQPDDKNKGLRNPIISYKGLSEVDTYSVFYEAAYSFGLEKQKSYLNSGEGNQAEGQNKLSLELGTHSLCFNSINLGVLANFTKRFDGQRINISSSTESKVELSGGDEKAIFFFVETNNDLHLNGSIGYKTMSPTESIFANSTTSKTDELTLVILNGSLRYLLTNSLSLIPKLTINTGSGDNYLGKYDSYDLQIGARYLF